MMTAMTDDALCPDDRLASIVSKIAADEREADRDLTDCLAEYPADPRLHFLKGSLLAAAYDYPAAKDAMRHAVDLAPDYGIARFQLGFLRLTCGEPHPAQEAWGPLYGLPRDNYLRIFAVGLTHLLRDEFDDAIEVLRKGIALNEENPALNGDMQLIIDEILRRDNATNSGAEPLSSVHLLLQQSALKETKH